MKFKALLGFLLLFAVYHSSELVGDNPIFILACFILFFAAAQIVAKLNGEKGLTAFGLQRQPALKHRGTVPRGFKVLKSPSSLFVGYLLGVFFYGGSFIVSVMTGKIEFGGSFHIGQMILPLLGIMLITFLSSASEDILTRGYVFKYLSPRFSLQALVIISSVIYVLNHIWRIDDSYTQWLMLFLMGLTYAIPFALTGSLWFTIGCHWGWNTVSLFKSQIGNMSDFNVIDHTTDWTYIYTMMLFLLFIIFYSNVFLKKKKQNHSVNI